jgi:hypothetical protein
MRISNTDLDLGDKVNADPDPKHCLELFHMIRFARKGITWDYLESIGGRDDLRAGTTKQIS